VTCAIDARRFLPELTPLYFGNASFGAVLRLPDDEVVESHVGTSPRPSVLRLPRSTAPASRTCCVAWRSFGHVAGFS
jgi:hypothetical protein